MSQTQVTPPTAQGEPEDWEREMAEVLGGDPATPPTPTWTPPAGPEHGLIDPPPEEPVHAAVEQVVFELPPQGSLPLRWHVVDAEELPRVLPDITDFPVGLVHTRPDLWDGLVALMDKPQSHPLKGDSRLATVLFTLIDAKDWTLTPTVHRYVDIGRPEPGKQELHVVSQICLWRGAPWWVIINYSEAAHGIESLFLVNANLLA